MRKLIVANWKENPATERQAIGLAKAIVRAARAAQSRNADVVICPPFIYLEKIIAAVKKADKKTALGAQDVFWIEQGAFTSEIGPEMLKKLGLRYVIVGHSERRKYAKETDTMINAKIKSALKDGLNIILCVGEALAVRKQGIAAARRFVKNQLKKDLKNIKIPSGGGGGSRSGSRSARNGSLVIAYEPIWAIGTGRNDAPEDARIMAQFIKDVAEETVYAPIRFLYGGSVNGGNAADYIQYKEIDGALVGGASLKAGEFGKIIKSTQEI